MSVLEEATTWQNDVITMVVNARCWWDANVLQNVLKTKIELWNQISWRSRWYITDMYFSACQNKMCFKILFSARILPTMLGGGGCTSPSFCHDGLSISVTKCDQDTAFNFFLNLIFLTIFNYKLLKAFPPKHL